MFTFADQIPVAAAVFGLIVNAVLYSTVLYAIAPPGRAATAASTAMAATVIPVVSLPLVADATLFIVGWPFAYVLAWSIARRVGIGLFGVIAATIVVVYGYAMLMVYFVMPGPASEHLVNHASGAIRIGWVIIAAANVAFWLEEVIRERITRRTTTPAPRETAPAFPSS
ncbi:hypothetical protein [Gordonia malaquae]|nr:hypothetical protein [Gordonia malaquae]